MEQTIIWTPLASVLTTKQWQFSAPTNASVFRIRHQLSETFPLKIWRFYGYIAKARLLPNGNSEITQIRRLYPKPELDVIRFDNPLSVGEWRVAVRGQLRYLTKISWIAHIEETGGNVAQNNTFFIVLDEVSYSRDPENSDLWVSTFREFIPYEVFEVGRFYEVETNEVVSDPFVDTKPSEITAIFIGKTPINPGQIKVKIIV